MFSVTRAENSLAFLEPDKGCPGDLLYSIQPPNEQRQIEMEYVMEDLRAAYFLHRPRRISDLLVPHLLEQEHPYTIVGEVKLSLIDYENFTEDLLADRAFLERYDGPLSVDGVYQCLLVREWSRTEGILVVPKDGFVFHAAAYLP